MGLSTDFSLYLPSRLQRAGGWTQVLWMFRSCLALWHWALDGLCRRKVTRGIAQHSWVQSLDSFSNVSKRQKTAAQELE